MHPFKKLCLVALMAMMAPIILPVEPAHAGRMSNEKQAVISHQYNLMKDADKIVIHRHTGTDQTLTNPDQIRQVVQFFQQRQFQWHRPYFSNSAPFGQYAIEFFLVDAPLLKVGVGSRSANFRDDGRSYHCNLSELEVQELTRLVQGL